MSFPAMSVYEFEHFKEEEEVLEYWKSSSIYIICQRPVLYFDEIWCNEENGIISMKIKQRGRENQLSVRLSISPRDQDLSKGFWAEFQFYEKEQQTEQPFRNAAGVKFLTDKNEFVVWLSPERLIFTYCTRKTGFDIEIKGPIHDFLTYKVHYIGQAQNQGIWQRLTGHEKLSKALTLEHPFIEGEFSPWELSLIFLKFDGFSEATLVDQSGSEYVFDSRGKKLTTEELAVATIPKTIEQVRSFAINDFEAYLVNMFQPKYNKILFKSYPDISNGLKAIGFDEVNHRMILFANLVTEEATYLVKISPVYTVEGE